MASINRNLCIVPLLRGSSFPWSRGNSPGAGWYACRYRVIMVPGTYMPCSTYCLSRPPFLDHLESFPFLLNVLATFEYYETVLTKRSSIPCLWWMPLKYAEVYSCISCRCVKESLNYIERYSTPHEVFPRSAKESLD